ncbi:hypothetical protein PG994_005596 [Apiospora phragmitis]|uniref:Uncharacterized protein n=1 Tax=Apiospora phragmitis TaxID=2905665 RepID=A0ABR1VCP1_9PEZI
MKTPQHVVSDINTLTQKSKDLQAPAQSLNIINGPLIQIITGLSDIVTTLTAALPQMEGMPNVAEGKDANGIADAFREFVRVQQALLNIVIGKAGLFPPPPLSGSPWPPCCAKSRMSKT